MFRPKGNAGQASPTEASAAEDTHQPMFDSSRNGEQQLNTPASSTSRVTQQTMFRPVRNIGPATTTSAASSSRTSHQDMPQRVSQPANNAGPNHTISTQQFRRAPRFLLSARGNFQPTNASAASTSRATRPVSRLIDSIESDDMLPPPGNAFATSTPHVTRPASPLMDSIEFDDAPPLPASRNTQHSMLQSGRNSNAGSVNYPAVSSSSRIAQQQHVRNTGPTSIGSINIPSTSTSRASRLFPLPGRIEIGQTTTPTTPAPHATHLTHLPVPRPMSNVGPSHTPTASTSRMAQQPVLQATRSAISTQGPTASTSRMAPQPTIQPTRTLPAQNPSASSSRTTQQPTFRPVRATAVPVNTPAPSASSTILEFVCLYTHDLRRKKKRWQDGKLKFHTFNKKYMVYDDSGSFVGDGHWQGDESEFAEGLEMNLDRGMAIVQVMECTGSKEQDLGEVLGKRAREVEERRINAAAKNPASTASSNPAKRSRGVAAVVQAAPTTTTTAIPPPPRNGGAWSKHAVDLLGMTRPSR